MQLANQVESIRGRFEAILKYELQELYPLDLSFHQACRYALSGQGKRVRPLLVYLSYMACGKETWQDLDSCALAIEMIHTYSLVHDDLPCMDNDDWRRGRPTTHKTFDEATALLVGDSLLTDALQIMARPSSISAKAQVQMIAELGRAAGGQGMILGQAMDLHWTGRKGFTNSDLDRIHQLKTGRLIASACVMAAYAADCNNTQVEKMRSFGECLGLAFQIQDDLLDRLPATGKTQGKDLAQQKLTYLQLMSFEDAQKHAQNLTDQAFSAIADLGPEADGLRSLASSLLDRNL